MALVEATTPAAEAARGRHEVVHLSRLNDFDANSSVSRLQASHIARRFNLPLALAAVVALNAFQTAEARS